MENEPTLDKLHSKIGHNFVRFFSLKDSPNVQEESLGVAKVLESGKNAMEILDSMDSFATKKTQKSKQEHMKWTYWKQ